MAQCIVLILLYFHLQKNKGSLVLLSTTDTTVAITFMKNRDYINDKWYLSDCNWTRTHNHLVRKRILNHLAKLAKRLSCVASTYLYGAFDCMFLPCHVRVSEWIHTLRLPECQGIPCSKQARNLKFKCLQLDSNPQLLSS